MMEFKITGAYIQLNQLLKATGWVENGSEANNSIDAGTVKVNGTTEHRKRNKLVPGDIIEFRRQSVTIR